jgi:hypothetical protein
MLCSSQAESATDMGIAGVRSNRSTQVAAAEVGFDDTPAKAAEIDLGFRTQWMSHGRAMPLAGGGLSAVQRGPHSGALCRPRLPWLPT